MSQPFIVQVTGTATSTVFFPDFYQNPFNIGLGVYVLTGTGGTAFLSVDHCFDYRTVYAPSFNGVTALVDGAVKTAVWFQNSGLGAATGTGTIGTTVSTVGMDANYAFAVAALRVNVMSSTATTIVVANFLQSVNGP